MSESAILIDGKKVVENELLKLRKIREKLGKIKVSVIQVGEDKASQVYINNKISMCDRLHIDCMSIKLPEETSQGELLDIINSLNNDNSISGILVQLPLPSHIDENIVAESIDINKDIDCFRSRNLGEVVKGNEVFSPCTPRGIFTLLENYNIDVEGKKVVVVGRSNIVGKPLVNMLINRGATVISCNSKTDIKDIINFMFECDIFISAIGVANYFNLELIKKYRSNFDYICPVIIDVGINRDKSKKLCGDVDKDLRGFVDYITPVPGGVGRTTVLELMRNILNSKKLN